MTAADPILSLRDLRVEIPTPRGVVKAVDGVTLDVPRGGALGLVGESGCGKSMTLRAILGLLPGRARIAGGEVVFDGRALSARSLGRLRGDHIGMVFQEPMTALNPVMRVGEQIAEGPRVRLGRSASVARERALELLRLVGIPDPERRYQSFPHELSGGLRQRIVIAIALACEPKLLLCDEPTTALDVTIQDQILHLLARLRAETGVSQVLVTHDLAVVAQTCERVAVMYAARIVETGTVAEVFGAPKHPYTRALLRSVPDFDERRAHLESIAGMPPDLVSPPSGCRFHPRCDIAHADCAGIDPPLIPIAGDRATACRYYEELGARV
ncbi:MAG: peptide/nickel transport system ATP-binding protein [Gaiellales bacterium]|nr:peptide/nickel transport system ATP-binding protein [Gaiellales bacterium]